ncbi:MAG: phosphonate ABC transporter ATP-binding protein [Actinomycetes bacterium]
MTAATTPNLAAVQLDRVSVVRNGTQALRDVSLTVHPGEQVALLGPSGAGKSTLLGLLNGTVCATSGELRLLGLPWATASTRQRRRLRARVGTVHQHLELVGPLRVVHNVNAGRLGRWSGPRAAWSLLRPFGVPDVRAALQRVGLDDRLYDRTDELSGGEQQRVALARVVLQDPALVLADEPVSHLDPQLAAHVLGLLTGLAADRTLVTSLHDPVLAARFCSRLVGLRAGRVLFDLPAGAVTRRALDALYG